MKRPYSFATIPPEQHRAIAARGNAASVRARDVTKKTQCRNHHDLTDPQNVYTFKSVTFDKRYNKTYTCIRRICRPCRLQHQREYNTKLRSRRIEAGRTS